MSPRKALRLLAVSTVLLCCTGSGPIGGVNAVVPYTPLGVVAVAGENLAAVSWLVPVQSQSATERNVILQYTVTSSPDATHPNGVVATCAGDVFGVTVNGLTNGSPYTFIVIATNEAGASDPSAPSNEITPSSVPGPPTNVFAVGAGEDAATVTWTPPANSGGSQIIGFVVTATPDGVAGGQGFTVDGTTTTATLMSLDDALSYNFTVTALNNIGQGPPSSATNSVTTVFPPTAPTNVTALNEGGDTISVFWMAPADNGGSFVQGYTVTALGGESMQTPQTPDGAMLFATFGPLTDGATYTFQVTATNLAGTSPVAVSPEVVASH